MKLISDVKTRLHEAMKLRNISQTKLSENTGIGKSAISEYLSGKYLPKQDKIWLLSRALGVSEAWLMGYDVSSSTVSLDKSILIKLNSNERGFYIEKLLNSVSHFDKEKLDAVIELLQKIEDLDISSIKKLL